MSVSVDMMRERIIDYYGPQSLFAKRVEEMPDDRIIAIYLRMKKEGLLQ